MNKLGDITLISVLKVAIQMGDEAYYLLYLNSDKNTFQYRKTEENRRKGFREFQQLHYWLATEIIGFDGEMQQSYLNELYRTIEEMKEKGYERYLG